MNVVAIVYAPFASLEWFGGESLIFRAANRIDDLREVSRTIIATPDAGQVSAIELELQYRMTPSTVVAIDNSGDAPTLYDLAVEACRLEPEADICLAVNACTPLLGEGRLLQTLLPVMVEGVAFAATTLCSDRNLSRQIASRVSGTVLPSRFDVSPAAGAFAAKAKYLGADRRRPPEMAETFEAVPISWLEAADASTPGGLEVIQALDLTGKR